MGQKQRKIEALVPLDQRFEMEHDIRGERFKSASGLWMATDRADGELYLLWLIEKTGAAVDRDVARILADTVRRVRGVLARKSARKVLLEVIDLVEDDREIGNRFAGADGTPTTLSGRSRRTLENTARTLSGRASIWRQTARLVRGLSHLHAADLVHGGIDDGAIFTANIEPLELKLGGYEGCVHVGSLGSGGAGLLCPGRVVGSKPGPTVWSDAVPGSSCPFLPKTVDSHLRQGIETFGNRR
ncbi:hypothetical protein [Thalassovita taeanensis]|uniref:Protein kinase domain-containing protein n=1 Tax=Thalassovita taeanensis TaxID=657014 RepID=A0A1H9D636_9RHOB|nr:hypothetical protein [Thalassovita taeanensis]SEQ08323.1 hypothetical protein SAMN04488092_1043 [Thalassovita taeanensis]